MNTRVGESHVQSSEGTWVGVEGHRTIKPASELLQIRKVSDSVSHITCQSRSTTTSTAASVGILQS